MDEIRSFNILDSKHIFELFIQIVWKSINVDFDYESEMDDGECHFNFETEQQAALFVRKYNALKEIIRNDDTKISYHIVDELVEKYRDLYTEIAE